MNCNDIRDRLFGYVEGLLDEAEKEAVACHLDACSVCRDELAGIEQLQERLVADGSAFADGELENAVVDRIVREQTFKLRKTERANHKIGVWRNIMKTKVTKYAAAAVIIIAVMIGLGVIDRGGDGGSVVWAEVAERVAKVKAVIYRARVEMAGMKGMPEGKVLKIEMEMIVSADDGMVAASYMDGELTMQMFAQVEEQAMVTLVPAEKKYTRIVLTDDIFEKMREDNHDPKQMVEHFLKGEYTELGRREINGVTVEGVASSNVGLAQGTVGNVSGRLWVDVETGWPVQITMEVLEKDGEVVMEMVMEDFEWDAEVDADVFVAEIPDDYELMMELDLGKLDSGEMAVEGLRYFAELTDGKYPSELMMMTINEEMQEAIKARIDAGTYEKMSEEDTLQLMGLNLAGTFFGGLAAEDKDPAYYGETVTAADAGKVLLRWRLDDGNYRVIYGDLRIEDVSASRLGELEAE
jgi:anti-sigma-K factor RskA